MNERQRMQYLDAMGIDMFVPKVILPNAKASVVCELPVASAAESAANQSAAPPSTAIPTSSSPPASAGFTDQSISGFSRPDSPQSDSSTPIDVGQAAQNVLSVLSGSAPPLPLSSITATAPASELLDEPVSSRQSDIASGPENTHKVAEAESVSVEDVSASEDNTPATFSLSVWRISEDVLIVDSRRPQEALPTYQLLKNMLSSVGLLNSPLPREDVVNWPVDHTPGRDQGWPAAREMMCSFLEGKLLVQPVKYMLLLGEDAGKAIISNGEEASYQHALENNRSEFAKVSVDAFIAEAYVLPSLADILYTPELKRAVWFSLNDLRNHVS